MSHSKITPLYVWWFVEADMIRNVRFERKSFGDKFVISSHWCFFYRHLNLLQIDSDLKYIIFLNYTYRCLYTYMHVCYYNRSVYFTNKCVHLKIPSFPTFEVSLSSSVLISLHISRIVYVRVSASLNMWLVLRHREKIHSKLISLQQGSI